MLKFTVIICAYTEDRWDDLISSVSSVRAQSYPPDQIIIVIDHNRRLLDRARAQFPDITLLENNDERGLSGARNSGISVATGDIIAFIDEDATASPKWLTLLNENFADPQVMGVGGAIIPNWENGRPAWFPREFDWVVGCTYTGLPEQTAPVRNLIGCNMSFRREIFEGIGIFRNGIGRVGTIPVGCEETEICIRARQKWMNGNFIFEPRASVLHNIPEKRKKFDYFRSRCYGEGISKALIARFVGQRDGTQSEWTYTLNVLPRGVLKGFGDLLRGDLAGIQRALAIVTGLLITTSGFLVGKFSKTQVDISAVPMLAKVLATEQL
jgi:GT2 family glycosyltransferase